MSAPPSTVSSDCGASGAADEQAGVVQGLPCEDWGPGPAGWAVEDQDARQRQKMRGNSMRHRGAQELVQGRKTPQERWETYQLRLRSGRAVASRPGSHTYFHGYSSHGYCP